MKPKLIHASGLIFLAVTLTAISSCTAIIEPSIAKRKIQAEAPVDQYQSTSYTVGFWWDQVDDALTYRLQIVAPKFDSVSRLIADTVIKTNKFSMNLDPGEYQWRVRAENGSSQTDYTAPRNLTILHSSIKQQSVQLLAPANNLVTNQAAIVFKWSNLYGATKYHLEIDTNNFTDETKLVYNQSTPSVQLSFTLPKDQTYQWRVRAENDTAQAQWSAIKILTYDHTPPDKATLVAPANNTTLPLPITLQWNTIASAIKYKLYLYKSDGVSSYNGFPITLTSTNYVFSVGSSGDKVYWKVSALDAAGNEGTASDLNSFMLQ